MRVVEVTSGTSPLILAMPHTGLNIPPQVFSTLNENGQLLADTDWHIEKLYEGLIPEATIVRALFHRYVIDANRDPNGESLYPGQNTTGLCPVTDFNGEPIYRPGMEPGSDTIGQRKDEFHRPYHEALQSEIDRIYRRFGTVILYDCHSIRSKIPFLFDGDLPDFNIGTNEGQTCSKSMQMQVAKICQEAENYSSVTNGRFKGGWTTRNYGNPDQKIHAIQMELAQITHLQTEQVPFDYSPQRADKLRVHLQKILEELTRQAIDISKKG